LRASVCGLLLMWSLTAVLQAQAATFNYEAYIAGARAGKATVVVDLAAERYVVSGTAEAEGVADLFGSWRTRFHANGQLVDAVPQLTEYAYVERDADEQREVTVRDGRLKYFKNGRMRRDRESPAGLDVLTALFVRPSCAADREVHSGRKEFRLLLVSSQRAGVCRYQVVDDDDDRYEAVISFGQRGDLTVPISITLHGFLTGRMVLVDH